jgi:hypothetical protein
MDLPSVQRVVEGMGSAQNLQIARLWKARSLILVEGDDMKTFKRIYDLVSPASVLPLDAVPNWSIGGWSGWARAIGSVAALHNSVDQKIRAYCIFDSDYHLDEDKNLRMDQARASQIELHILEMKEVENYLVKPSLIRRVIEKSISSPKVAPSEDEIAKAIEVIVADLLDAAQDCYVTEFLNADRSGGAATASRKARVLIAQKCGGARGALGIVSGKELISRLTVWSKKEYDVSFGVNGLLRMMHRNEVDAELERIVVAMGQGRSFH